MSVFYYPTIDEIAKPWIRSSHIIGDLVESRSFKRILHHDDPTMNYKELPEGTLKTIHWGQRKLLLSEIEFLSMYANKDAQLVIYPGSAPGTHIKYLSELFPQCKFILIDPNTFHHSLQGDKFIIINDLMTDEVCSRIISEYHDVNDALLISDIRAVSSEMTEKQRLSAIDNDQELQLGWHMKLKPKRSMFKFRLPWTNGTTKYLAGDIYLPIFGKQQTTETRLISKEHSTELIDYDNKLYERQLAYFNIKTRQMIYDHNIPDSSGLCHCYDCRAEISVLYNYLTGRSGKSPLIVEQDYIAKIVDMSNNISVILGYRTLNDVQPTSDYRKMKSYKSNIEKIVNKRLGK